jgi:hypothetical protein
VKTKLNWLVFIIFSSLFLFCYVWGSTKAIAQGKGEYKGKRVMVVYWQKGNDSPLREDQAVDAASIAIRENFGRNQFVVVKEPVVSQEKASEEYFLNLAQGEDADILVLFNLVSSVDENTAFGSPKAYIDVTAAAYDARRKTFFCGSEERDTESGPTPVLALRDAGKNAGWDAASDIISRIKRKFIFVKREQPSPPLAVTPKQ